MPPSPLALTAILTLALTHLASAAEKWVTIGDSLTKEYALEFPLLNPDNPAAWSERNWLEILSEHRSEHVDIGPLALWSDTRLTGHEYNWAFPGSTSEEWREILEDDDFLSESFFLKLVFDPYLEDEADRVVIFLGGNDLKNNYTPYYNGADPEPFIASLVSNIRFIVDYVRDENGTVPIVLTNMPDVGVTPTVQASKPDAEKRALNTSLTEEVNRRLQLLASEKDIGFADIGALTAQLTGPEHFVIAGARFEKGVDPNTLSNEPQYLFSPDGFHPNTTAQILFANAIARGFNEHYPDLTPVPLFSTEEMLDILGIEADMSFSRWADAYGVVANDPDSDLDGDGLSLFAEFAIGMDPRIADQEISPSGGWQNNQLEIRYQQRLANSTHVIVTPESSTNLMQWSAVPANQRAVDTDNTTTAWVPPSGPAGFLRVAFESP